MRWVTRLGLDFVFLIIMLLFLAATLARHNASLKFAQQSVLYPIGIMVFVLLSRWGLWLYRRSRGGNGSLSPSRVFWQTLRDWTPFILIDFIYENLHDLSQYFQTHDIAGTLMAWDEQLFGVEPVIWSQQFFHPALVDYMALAYASYFILPLFIMYLLACRNRRAELKEMILALSLAFIIGFMGYVLFPCSPPRYFIDFQTLHPPQLYGYFIYNALQAKWDSLSAIRSGAFPSLHVGISTVALVYAFRFRNWSRFDYGVYLSYVVIVTSLWISTVYLRHHWVIDIVAGWILALFSAYAAPILVKYWLSLRAYSQKNQDAAYDGIDIKSS